MSNFIKVTALQLDNHFPAYVAADKITSVTSTQVIVEPPVETEDGEKTPAKTKKVTVINIAGQSPIFVKESAHTIIKRI